MRKGYGDSGVDGQGLVSFITGHYWMPTLVRFVFRCSGLLADLDATLSNTGRLDVRCQG
jgi:hypothetical protein